MLVRCKTALKQRVMRNAKNLKDKTNEQGDYFFINKQLPDQLNERKRNTGTNKTPEGQRFKITSQRSFPNNCAEQCSACRWNTGGKK